MQKIYSDLAGKDVQIVESFIEFQLENAKNATFQVYWAENGEIFTKDLKTYDFFISDLYQKLKFSTISGAKIFVQNKPTCMSELYASSTKDGIYTDKNVIIKFFQNSKEQKNKLKNKNS